MFNKFDYFSSILADVPGILSIKRVSSITQLEEVLSDLRGIILPCLVVNDSGDGYLDLRDRRFMAGYHNVYVFTKARVNDSPSRVLAKQTSLDLGIALFDRMKLDSEEYGQPAYGLDDSRIDYSEIGPLADNCYGYGFGFSINNEF